MNSRILRCVVMLILMSAAVLAPAQCTRCGPGLTVSPHSLSFPPQVVATTSAAMTVTLRSVGIFPVTFNGIVSSGPPFSETNNCPHALPRSATCHIRVTFAPTAIGTFNGAITISDNAGMQVVTLSGTGVARVAGISAAPSLGEEPLLQLSAQQSQHHYKLVDLGTLGGPVSYGSVNGDGGRLLNHEGVVSSFADTSNPDPNAPDFCFDANCLVAHAYRWKNGVITDIGALSNTHSSAPGSINARGWSVGQSQSGIFDPIFGFPQLRAVLWKGRKVFDLGTLPGGSESLGISINDAGQVVGLSDNGVPDPFSLFGLGVQIRTFLWQAGQMQDIGTLGGPDALPGPGCDNQRPGTIVGVSYTSFTPNQGTGIPTQNPFLWHNGKMIDLGNLGGTFSVGQCANNRGDVIGLSNLPGDLTFHAFVWRKGKMKDLGTLGGDDSEAIWINDAGDIVGSADLPAPGIHDAVRWRKGQILDLGTVSGDACSRGRGINARGQIVGGSSDCHNFLHAFVWEEGGPMLDLNTLIPAGSGLQLTNAININDRGEILAKSVPLGVTPVDDEDLGHVVLLVPCEEDGNDCENVLSTPTNTALRSPSLIEKHTDALRRPLAPRESVAEWRERVARQHRITSGSPPN